MRRVRLAGIDVLCDLRVRGRRVAALAPTLAPVRGERVIDGQGLAALPGLINAHDHLPLNLLPHLGDPPYPSLYAFAEAIYRPDESPIRELVHQIGLADRFWWGAYKNLISGVTTVAHHDPYNRRVFGPRLFGPRFPIKVLKRYAWAHSLRFAEDPARAFRQSRGAPFIIHAAEGVDDESAQEIDRLDEMGVLAPNTIIVHGLAISPAQRARLADAGAGLIWCPASNLRLYGRSARADWLAEALPVALGTDSTLSGAPTLLDEARTALATGLADAETLLSMMTDVPARLLQLRDGRGTLAIGRRADLVLIADQAGASVAKTLLTTAPADIALVLVDGQVRRAAPHFAEALGLGVANAWVDGSPTWLYGDLRALRQRIRRDALRDPRTRDSAREALSRNPLWTRLRTSPPA